MEEIQVKKQLISTKIYNLFITLNVITVFFACFGTITLILGFGAKSLNDILEISGIFAGAIGALIGTPITIISIIISIIGIVRKENLKKSWILLTIACVGYFIPILIVLILLSL